MADGDYVTQREFENRLADRAKALDCALVELRRRMQELNSAHELARQKEVNFFSRQSHDEFAKDLDRRLEAMKAELRPKWGWLASAASAIIVAVIALWNLSTATIELRLKNLEQRSLEQSLLERQLGEMKADLAAHMNAMAARKK